MATLKRFKTEADLANGAAELFIAWANEAIREHGRFRAALSGGRGPRGLFAILAHRHKDVDWRRVELYWVDERWVPFFETDSNFGEAERLWLDGLAPGPLCFPMYDQALEPDAAAKAYEDLLVKNFGGVPPVFDLILLGMGPDGHTASLFPGQDSVHETRRLCLAVKQPSSGQQRVTLTLPVINAAKRCVFLLSGAEKAGLLAEVLAGNALVPAAHVRPAQGETLWLADATAAPYPA
jgi:6-phosphogluconolactonase